MILIKLKNIRDHGLIHCLFVYWNVITYKVDYQNYFYHRQYNFEESSR